jgi:hypothetical protein
MSLPRMVYVDHIIEVKDGGAFWDAFNLQVLCRYHHYSKTIETMGDRRSGRGQGGRRFARDGHWNDKPTGREPASPNGFGCDNPACAWCLERGFHEEAAR